MVYSLDGLRHYTVIRCDNEYCYIRRLCTTHTHGSKRLMSRCIEECDLLTVYPYNIRTDMLRDSAGLMLRYIGLTDGIKK